MENKDEVRYFNFPICLIKGFLNDHKKCLADILSYTLYEYVFTRLEIIKKDNFNFPLDKFEYLKGKNIDDLFVDAEEFYGISYGNAPKQYKAGKILFDSITQKRKGGFKLIYFLGLLQK